MSVTNAVEYTTCPICGHSVPTELDVFDFMDGTPIIRIVVFSSHYLKDGVTICSASGGKVENAKVDQAADDSLSAEEIAEEQEYRRHPWKPPHDESAIGY